MSLVILVFCFKQKTAYEMRICDWSSDVCSADLAGLSLASSLPCGKAYEKPPLRRPPPVIGLPIDARLRRARRAEDRPAPGRGIGHGRGRGAGGDHEVRLQASGPAAAVGEPGARPGVRRDLPLHPRSAVPDGEAADQDRKSTRLTSS